MGTRTTLMPLWATIRGGNWLLNNSLLWDSYNTADAAPVSDPLTAVPGPGLSTVTDTENRFAVTGRNLVCSGGKASPGWGDPGIWLGYDNAGTPTAKAMAPGYAAFEFITITANEHLTLGYSAGTVGSSSEPFFYFSTSNILKVQHSGAVQTTVGAYVDDTATKLLVPQRSNTHGYHFIQDGELVWTSDMAVTDPAFTAAANYNAAFSLHDLALVDLTAHGFTNDFLDVTDTKTNPASGTTFDVEADHHLNFTATVEDTKSVQMFVRYADAENYLEVVIPTDRGLQVKKRVLNTPTVVYTAGAGTLTDGVSYEFDLVCEGSTVTLYRDKVLEDSSTVAELTTNTGGYAYNTLATNDIVLTTHPNPALGIATDRVIAPQAADVWDSSDDCLSVIKNISWSAGNSIISYRYTDASNTVDAIFINDGSFILRQWKLGVNTDVISAGAGTVSVGDDVVVVLEGASAEVFVAGTSIGTTSSLTLLSGSGSQHSAGGGNAVFDYIACFPRTLSGMPPILIDPDVGDPGDTPAAWGGQFWNWEDYTIGETSPDNIHSSMNLLDPSVQAALTIDGFDVTTLGYSKVFRELADATGNYIYLEHDNTYSSGEFRCEILCAHVTASSSQADFFHANMDLAANSDQNRVEHAISKNTSDPRHRYYHKTGGAQTTPIDTTTTGTWVTADSTGWTLCQLTWDFSTGVGTTEFKNLSTGHTTGVQTTAALSALGAGLAFTRAGIRNQSGNHSYIAQVWVGTGDDGWPNGFKDGTG